jgi:8-oxo-dGTP pyrophosphatase MutT (NUDIX family)
VPISDYLRELRRHIGTAPVLMPSVGALIHDAGGRLLLEVRSDNGDLMLPGGAIDPGESPRRAVVREVLEETGLTVEPTHLVAVVGPYFVEYPNGDRVEYTGILLWCEVVGGTLHPGDGECAGFRWVEPDEVPELGYPPAVFRWRPGMPPWF